MVLRKLLSHIEKSRSQTDICLARIQHLQKLNVWAGIVETTSVGPILLMRI